MGGYEKSELVLQIIVVLSSIFLFGSQMAFFIQMNKYRSNLLLDDLRIAVGSFFLVFAVVTFIMELPEKAKADKIQNKMIEFLGMYATVIQRSCFYMIISVFICCYMSFALPLGAYTKEHKFAIVYLVAGVLFALCGVVGIIMKVVKK